MKEIKNYSLGLKFIFSGFSSINSTKGLWKRILVPFVIDIFLLSYFLVLGVTNLPLWVASALGLIFTTPSGWLYSLLYYPLFLILGLGFSVITVFGVYLLASVIASPFYSVIVEKILMKNSVIAEQPFSFSRWVSVSVRMMGVSLLRAFIFALVGIPLFICSFIPGLNIASSFSAFLIMGFDSMDYSYELHELSLKQRIQHFKSHLVIYSGMATVIGLTMLLPGLTLLLMPFLVAGSAEIYSKTRCKANEPGINT